MKDSIRNKLETTRERFEELEGLMSDPDVIKDQDQFRDLRKEYARLEPIIGLFQQYETLSKDLIAAKEMVSDSDAAYRTPWRPYRPRGGGRNGRRWTT